MLFSVVKGWPQPSYVVFAGLGLKASFADIVLMRVSMNSRDQPSRATH
jgi:hypothetical protein